MRFLEHNNSGVVLSSREFLKNIHKYNRAAVLKTINSGAPRYINRNSMHRVDKPDDMSRVYRPMFPAFFKTDDIKTDGYNKVACAIISGVDSHGDKIAAIHADIKPFILVMVPFEYRKNTAEFKTLLVETIGYSSRSLRFEEIKMYNYHKFQIAKKPCFKIVFKTLIARKMAIKNLEKKGYMLGEDDNDYTPMYLRHNPEVAINKWLAIPGDANEYCHPLFRDGVYSNVYISDEPYASLNSFEYPYKDSILTNAWDIETKKIGDDITIPGPGNNDYYISAISTSIGAWHDIDPVLSIVFTLLGVKSTNLTVPGKVAPMIVTCKNEHDLLKTYYKFIAATRPEYEQAFNGGNFDWPIMRDRTQFWTDAYIENNLGSDKICVENPKTPCDYFMAAYRHTIEPFYGEAEFKDTERRVQVKLEAGRASDIKIPNFFGTAFIDSMVLLCKAYPKVEQKNLQSFLQRANLGEKEDMPYIDMHKITEMTEIYNQDGVFEFENKITDAIEDKHPGFNDRMCRFMYYSYIDSLKLYWLFNKESFILSTRALADLGRFPVLETFFRASGAILMNMIAIKSYKAQRLFSVKYKRFDDGDESKDTEESFSGAYVVPPVYGLHTDRPITGVDFSSLYPSLMAAFNLSPDMVVPDDQVEYFKSLGYTVLSLEIPYKIVKRGKKKDKNKDSIVSEEICKANFIQHNGIIDPETDKNTIVRYVKDLTWSLDGRVVLEYQGIDMKDTREYLQGANLLLAELGYDPDSVKYSYKIHKIFGRKKLKNECMGVNAKLGQDLFDLRNQVKKPFGAVKTLIEYLEAHGLTEAPWDKREGKSVPGAPMHSLQELHEIFEQFNAQQLAIKIMANTIYGKSGENRSFIYALEVAAGITFCGQNKATKPMIDLVKSLGCEVMYGDTDSLYIKCPWEIYNDLIESYKNARFERFGINHHVSVYKHEAELSEDEAQFKVEHLWTPMVILTRKYINFVTEIIADTLCSMNNTRYLTMAYEEVGFPTYLSGKKKYALIAHEKEINFFPRDIFLRGFDFKKRGQTKIARRIGGEFLKKILSPSFHGDSLSLMKQTLRSLTNENDYHDFIVYKTYRPDKKAIEVQTIVNDMTKIHNDLKTRGKFLESELWTPPLPGETFPVVYVQRQRNYDINGKVDAKFSAAELAKPWRVIEAAPETFRINHERYLEKMKGFLGRLIIAESIFDHIMPEKEHGETDDEYYTKSDKERTKAAQKYIMSAFKIINGDCPEISSSARLMRSAAKITKNLNISSVLSSMIVKLLTGYFTDLDMQSFTISFGAFVEKFIDVKYAIDFGLPRGMNSTTREVDDFFEARELSAKTILTEFIGDAVMAVRAISIAGLCTEQIDGVADEIARGSISIHFGAVYLKHPHREVMYSFTKIMDMIRLLETYRAERKLFASKPGLKTKKEIIDDAREMASKSIIQF